MIRLDASHTSVASASNPGVVRNFRVQVRESNASDWQMHSIFRRRSDAESCVSALQICGVYARLVDCDRCPTAL
jgi:hypothetical protein